MNCLPFVEDFTKSNDEDINVETIEVIEKSKPIGDNIKTVSPTEPAVKPDTTKIQKLTSNNQKTSTVSQKTASKPVSKKTAKTTKPKARTTAKKSSAKKTKSTKKNGDNIKKINGIGPAFEKKLNSIGVNKFEHIAAWSVTKTEEIDQQLELSGRPQREEWVAKAKILAAEKNV